MAEEIKPGTLYIVPTPIGNLDDITYRAVKILSAVDAIAAEDTRTTKVLLDHLRIQKPLISFFNHNETIRVPQIVDKLKGGSSIALVSDAGTPGISDPAYSIITACIESDVDIVSLPGPTAFVPVLVASGLPAHSFIFEGFLPHKKGRATKIESLKGEPRTIVFYESPHRILRTLQELEEKLGDRKAVVGREVTKKFEEMIRGNLSTIRESLSARQIKGEFVLVVAGFEG
ncbi:MAG TPA: 16S rRNA (cytidine(1402)-2'-O)-methyltransferase [Bacteroidota bacterium]|nr:16S rRNA (cytidine(1402)-2'-O)-methyltransferase [Bacteroidota bacterium]